MLRSVAAGMNFSNLNAVPTSGQTMTQEIEVLRFFIRHPLFLLFLLGVIGLSSITYNKIQNPAVAAGMQGRGPGGPGMGQPTMLAVETVFTQLRRWRLCRGRGCPG